MSGAILVEVRLGRGETSEKLIRRFFKKCKKQDIIKEHLEKVSYYKTNSQKRKDKILKNKHEKVREEKKSKIK
jgi:ribosomal protein S21